MSLQADPVRRIFATPMAEVLQRADDPVVTPAGVLPGHAHDEGFDSGVDARSAWIRPAFGSVELLGDQPSVPRRGWCRVWPRGLPSPELCVRVACRCRQACNAPDPTGAAVPAGVRGEYGSPQRGTRSAEAVPD